MAEDIMRTRRDLFPLTVAADLLPKALGRTGDIMRDRRDLFPLASQIPTQPPNQAAIALQEIPGAVVDTVARTPGVVGEMIRRGRIGDVPVAGSLPDPAADAQLMAGIQGQPIAEPPRPTMDQFKLQTILANAGAAAPPTATPRGYQTEAQKLGDNPTESILQGLSPRINSIAEKFAPEEVEAFRRQVGTPEALEMPEDRLRRFMALEAGGQGGITSGAGTPANQPGVIARNVLDSGQGLVSAAVRQPGAAVSAGIGAVLESAGSPRTAAPFFDNAREVGARNLPGDSVGGFVGQTVGSVAPSGIAMLLGPAGPALIAAYYGTQGYSTGYTMARDKALAEDREPDSLEASMVGMGYAAVESITEKAGFDVLVRRMPSLGAAVKAFQANPVGATAKGVLDEIGRLGAAGALEEGSSQFGQNVVTRGIDPTQKLGEGVPMAAAGGALGNLMLGGGQIARSGLQAGYDAATQNRTRTDLAPSALNAALNPALNRTPPEAPGASQTGPSVEDAQASTEAPPVAPVQPTPPSPNASRIPAAPPEVDTPQRARVAQEMADAFGDAEILPVVDAYAKGWAKGTGKSVDEYYAGLRVEKGGEAGAGALYMTAYHGSPHEFDKFKSERIDTGEGAQAYGHGLYFAGSRDVAEWYRKKLSEDQPTFTKGGKTIAQPVDMMEAYYAPGRVIKTADGPVRVDRFTKKDDGTWTVTTRPVTPAGLGFVDTAGAKPTTHATAPNAKELERVLGEAGWSKGKGKLYTVELAPTEAQFLDWDKPLAGQGVAQAIQTLRNAPQENAQLAEALRTIDDATTGRQIYRRLSGVLGEAGASKFLHENGVRGIRYPDASARATGTGASNYVVFDENDVTIQRMEQAAGGAAMGSWELAQSGQRIIRALANPNASTLPHELAHDFLYNLPAMDAALAERAAKALGVESHKDIGTPQHEQFARGFERYLRDGKAPSPSLRRTFARFKEWLVDLYTSIRGTPLERQMNPALKAVFDDMLTRGDDANPTAPTTTPPSAPSTPRGRARAARGMPSVAAGDTISPTSTNSPPRRLRPAERRAQERAENQASEVTRGMPAASTARASRKGPKGGTLGDSVATINAKAQASANPEGLKAGQTGADVPTVNDRTVAQSANNRPEAVERENEIIRNARLKARRDGTAESLAPHSRTFNQIMQEAASALNLGQIGRGRASRMGKNLAGMFTAMQADIRIKRGDDVATAMHETGHALAEMLLPGVVDFTRAGERDMTDAYPAAWRPELAKMGRNLYGSAKAPENGYVDEGWAEAVRLLVVNPKEFKTLAPTVYREVVTQLIREHPGVWNVLERVRLRLGVLRDLGDPTAGQIFNTEGLKTTSFRDDYSDFRIMYVDRYHRAADFVRDIGTDPAADANPHLAMLRLNGHRTGDIKALMETTGPWQVSDPTHTTPATFTDAAGKTKPIRPLLEILRGVWGNRDEWASYMMAKRFIEKRGQGFDTGGPATDQELKDFVEKAEKIEGFKEAAEEWQAFSEWMIRDYAVGHDLLTEDQADKIIEKNAHFIKFKPVEAFEASSRGGGSSTLVNLAPAVKRFADSTGEGYYDPIGASIAHVESIVSKARANEAANTFFEFWRNFAPGAGRWMSKVDAPVEGIHVGDAQVQGIVRKQVGEALVAQGLKPDDPTLAKVEQAIGQLTDITLWRRKRIEPSDQKRIAMVLKDGKPEYYEIKDRRLWEMYNNATLHGDLQIPDALWARIATGAAKTLRAGATQLNLLFTVTNALRDTTAAMVFSEADGPRMQRAMNRIRGMIAGLTGIDPKKFAAMYDASGANMSGIAGEFYDRQTFDMNERMVWKRMGMLERFAKAGPREVLLPFTSGKAATIPGWMRAGVYTMSPARFVEIVSTLNERAERMTRFGEFAAVLGDRRDATAIAEAGQAAADVTVDFSRGGRISKKASQYVPFFNAAIQSVDKFLRFVKANPGRSAAGIVQFVIAPTLLQLFMNADNEDYWAKPYQIRDRFWFFPYGEDENGKPKYFRIPKPYILALFASGIERVYAANWGIDPATGERGDRRATESLVGTFADQLLPPTSIAAIHPIVELATNHDFFRERPIVAEYEMGLPAEEQGYDRASEFGRITARMLNSAGADVAPVHVDHVIRGYFAGLGDLALRASDPLLASVIEDDMRPPKRDMAALDYLGARTLLAGATRGDHRAISRFYKEADRLAAIRRQYSRLSVDPARQAAYLERHRDEIRLAPAFAKLSTRMTEINKRRRAMWASPPEDPDEYSRKDRAFMDAIIETAKTGMRLQAGEVDDSTEDADEE